MRGVLGVAAAAALMASCGPALAWTGEVSWPTFFRAGPDRQYTVLDEMERGKTVEVLSCDAGWCKVQTDRTTGYVEQSALVQPSAMPAKPPLPGPADCFESRLAGYGKAGQLFRYCPR